MTALQDKKVKVIRSRNVSNQNAIIRQQMVISSSNLVEMTDIGDETYDIFSSSTSNRPEVKIWRTFS